MTRAFRLYLAGQLPSVVCSWAQVVAVTVVTLRLDAALLGWVVAVQFLPSLLLGPYFGVVADRHDRRVLLLAAEAGLGLVAAGYALASFTGGLTLPVLFVLAAAWGVLNALDTPARRALIPALMPNAPARSAALSGVVLLTGMTTGSALGGWLTATSGPGWVFAVNASSFAADVAILYLLGRLVSGSPSVPRAPRQVRDGIRYVIETPGLRAPIVALAVIGTFAITFQVSIPLLITDTFDAGAGRVGEAFAAVSGGSLAGAVWVAVRPPQRSIAAPAAAALATCCAVVAVAPTFIAALGCLALVGASWSVYLTATIAVLQGADPRYLGRVMSLFAVLLIGSTPVGGPVAGVLASALDPRAPFVLAAAAAAAGWLLLSGSRDRASAVADGGVSVKR